MIQKSLIGAVEREEQQEIDRIGRQRNAKNREEDIQMLPLHEAIIEVHREYERASKAARDMAESYKNVVVAAEQLNEQCTKTQAEKEELLDRLRQTEGKLKQNRGSNAGTLVT